MTNWLCRILPRIVTLIKIILQSWHFLYFGTCIDFLNIMFGEFVINDAMLVSLMLKVLYLTIQGLMTMPKAYKGELFSKIFSAESIMKAFRQVSRSKGKKYFFLKFKNKLGRHIESILHDVETGNYKPELMKVFYVYEPKKRLVETPLLRDRIVFQAIYNYLYPIFEKIYIHNSYASIKGRGIDKTADKVQQYINYHKTPYIVKFDVKSYFATISHDILIAILKKRIKDRKLISILETIIRSLGNKSNDRGIPIGALSSQLFANVYLNELDQYIVHHLGYNHYIRYMDDGIIIVDSRQEGLTLLNEIEYFLNNCLQLKLNPKSCVFRYHRMVYFCGYRIGCSFFLLRKRNYRKMKRRIRFMNKWYHENKIDTTYIMSRLYSFAGYARKCAHKKSIMVSTIDKCILFQKKKFHSYIDSYQKLYNIIYA